MKAGRHGVWAFRRAQALLLALVCALAPLLQLVPVPVSSGSIGFVIPICSATGVRYVAVGENPGPARDTDGGSSGQAGHPCCGICHCGTAFVPIPIAAMLEMPWNVSDGVSTLVPGLHSGRLKIDHFDARAPPILQS